ncbi:purine-cytosine permease family protein [Rhodococcus sp. NPDC057529]|uniref:purine-cytosine permease family protein n=1 Tax=Rhodococcus sp. NPDC057529 TaxID=3346158 RepID=UPI00366FBA3B
MGGTELLEGVMCDSPISSAGHAATAGGLPTLVTRGDDDPRVVADAAVDDYSLHAVPDTWRLNRVQIAFAWSALLAALFWVVLSATGAMLVGAEQALIGMAAAVVCHGVINFYLQKAAAETGLTLALFSRNLFGHIGAAVASLVFGITATFFAIFEGSVLAVAFHTYIGGSLYLWYAVVAVFCVAICLGGVRVWLEKLNAWLLPVFLLGLIGALVWSIVEYGYHSEWIHSEASAPVDIVGPGWLYVFVLYMGAFSNMFFTFDFARMGKKKDVRYNGHVTFGWVFYILAFLGVGGIGIYLSQTIPVDGVSEVGVVSGIVKMMGFWGLIYIFATQTKIQTANLYLGSSNFQSFFSRIFRLHLPRTFWLLVVGVIMVAVMYADVFSFLTEWLAYQGALLVAWTAVAIVQIAHNSRGDGKRFEFRPGRIPSVNPGGLGAWAAGSIVGIGLLATDSAFSLTFALIVTYVVSTVAYAGALFFARDNWFRLARPHDPLDEVSSPWDTRVQCHVCDKYYVAVEMDRDPEHGHRAICAECAAGQSFLRAARAEAAGVRQPTTPSRRSSAQ